VNSTHGLHFETATSGDGRNFSSYILGGEGKILGLLLGVGGELGMCREENS
jgi:hypothetical protein